MPDCDRSPDRAAIFAPVRAVRNEAATSSCPAGWARPRRVNRKGSAPVNNFLVPPEPNLRRLLGAGFAVSALVIAMIGKAGRRRLTDAPEVSALDRGSRPTAPRQAPTSPAVPTAPAPDDAGTSFTPQGGTRWLEPRLLLRSARDVIVSGLLGEYNDKRELMGSLEADRVLDLSAARTGGFWMDYVSDTGDGFDATYAVASLLAQPTLDLPPAGGSGSTATERGELLVMGGDQCYPSADIQAYEDRLIGPYRAALPEVTDGVPPFLLVVPGNHDWYDGLTAFMRTFCQRRWIGGWRTCQSRSYFAVKLPGRWWVWGIDIQFDTYIDDVQRRYFEQVATQLHPGDSIILCSAKPSWVAAGEDDLEAYATLDFLERRLVRPRSASIRVAISGDRHHYARYEASDGSQKITAGGGGAYLSPTHHLPRSIAIPPAASRARGKSVPTVYERQAVFPDPLQSRRLAWGVLRLPWLTPTFAALLGAGQAVITLAVASALSRQARGLPDRLHASAEALRGANLARVSAGLAISVPALTLSVATVAATIAFTKKARTARGLVAGGLHGLAQLAAAALTISVSSRVASRLPGSWLLAGLFPLVLVFGGSLAAEVVAVYLLVADRVRLNSNELFAGQGIPDFKNALRLHVDIAGSLTIYPIGLERVPRRWRPREHPGPQQSRFYPSGEPLSPVLIEPPIVVKPTPVLDGVTRAVS